MDRWLALRAIQTHDSWGLLAQAAMLVHLGILELSSGIARKR